MAQLPRVFSGVQPTGRLHLGNLLGAIKPWVRHQADRDNIFCVVDLHALTIPEAIDPAVLRRRSREVVATFLAAGIDPMRSRLFIQSHVRQHTELAWVLNCVTPLGWLERMTQFKSKSEGRGNVGTGLLDYPVLMAADILLYDTALVPVGDDQRQHIELTRDLALRFNHMFGDTFVVPKASIPEAGARVMGLDDPTVKMSKSLADERPSHAVFLDDTPKKVRKTIMRAVTDSGCTYDPETASPGVVNLMGILAAVTGRSVVDIAREFDGQGYGYLKGAVADAVAAELEPLQAEYARLMADEAALDAILDDSAARVRVIAEATMTRVRAAVGIG
ncbi:MAG: tryptophan--tRNA ligase [Alphaproteobacteria bacterium]|nr:tryptophan--tRNA ligase [Alphaproteobacteria bacterium]